MKKIERARDALCECPFTAFVRDERGTIAVMGSILMIFVMAAVMFSIDYSRATSLKSSLQSAADAAAVTASFNLGGEDRDVHKAFKKAFQANLPEILHDQAYSLSIAPDKKSLSVKMAARLETTIVQIAGVDEITFDVTAFATRPTAKLSAIARTTNQSGSGNHAATAQIAREIEDGLRAARAAGLPVPDKLSERDLELAAEILMRQLGGH